MTDFVGQRLTTGASDTLPGSYVRIPTSAASAMFRDGCACDAGAAMIYQSNLSHSVSESLRHLCTFVLGGTLSQVTGWSGIRDVPDPGGVTALSQISWRPSVSARFGPFYAIEDREADDGTPVLRKIVCETYAKSGASDTLEVYVAITAGLDPEPPLFGVVASETFSAPTSIAVTTKTLEAELPLTGTTPLRVRPASSTTFGAVETIVAPWWLWLGWKSTNGGDKLLSFAAYEGR